MFNSSVLEETLEYETPKALSRWKVFYIITFHTMLFSSLEP